jgi:hypothetical protein
MALTRCIQDKQGYIRTHTEISNTYCFSTATVTRERVSDLRYIACLFNFTDLHSVFEALSVLNGDRCSKKCTESCNLNLLVCTQDM